MITIPMPDWYERAICAQTDPEAFYPEAGCNPEPAKKVCATCPVRRRCLEWALGNGETFGVWGGTTYKQRQKMPGWVIRPRGAA